jgi:hypothetical protein
VARNVRACRSASHSVSFAELARCVVEHTVTTSKLDQAAACSIDYEIKEQRGVIVG